MRKLLLLNVAALSPRDVTPERMPNLHALATSGTLTPLREPLPSLTCTSHATMVTGSLPCEHGIVGNGWYERSHSRVFMWNRSAHQISGETLWDAARKYHSNLTVANLFWRFAADTSCELKVTERPVYWTSGRKTFDFYTSPPSLHSRLKGELGGFPFMHFWGPFAGIKSTDWILKATAKVLREDKPDILLAYAPYLDYEGQRHGPDATQSLEALSALDAALVALVETARDAEYDLALVSDYGFATVNRPISLNRILREKGFVSIEDAANGDQIETGTSRAFAVCDNQVAHVYVANDSDKSIVRETLEAIPGVLEVLDTDKQQEVGIRHMRSGDLIAVADKDSWFDYRYWLDPSRAPDFDPCIAIFDKAGFDPCELFPPPGPFGKLHIAKRVAQKMLRQAVPFDVIDPNPANPKGARLIGASPEEGATLVTSWTRDTSDVPMEGLKSLLLERMFADA